MDIKITLANKDVVVCSLGINHKCLLNVNDGYCCARECQFQVLEETDKEFQTQIKKDLLDE